MDRSFGYASIIDEKVRLFDRSCNDDIQFFFGKPTFGPPCIHDRSFVDKILNKDKGKKL